jgi:hypothetical protein
VNTATGGIIKITKAVHSLPVATARAITALAVPNGAAPPTGEINGCQLKNEKARGTTSGWNVKLFGKAYYGSE